MIQWSEVKVPSQFDPARRPIYIQQIATMSHKNKEVAYPAIANSIGNVIKRHDGDRILVHSVSYEFTDFIYRFLSTNYPELSERLVSYNQTQGRQRALDVYLAKEASILIAPSLDRGIDLPGNDCRAIVVAKIPYPNLGDKQINARLHSKDGQLWYTVQAVRSLVQMTGRGMRSKEDFCESYILDEQFMSSIWKKSRNLLPQWWTDALRMDIGRIV